MLWMQKELSNTKHALFYLYYNIGLTINNIIFVLIFFWGGGGMLGGYEVISRDSLQ